jgi:tRNA pseudouridine55 synthase
MQKQSDSNPREAFAEGRVLLFDKPYKWTSFDVVGKVRALLRHRLGLKKVKIGHAGTLDPLATGLLIICTGKLTKSIARFQDMEKEYTGTFFLGKTTPSFDLETIPDQEFPYAHITREMAIGATGNLTGKIEQEPPLFSAKKIEGERAYEHARRGEDTRLKAKKVEVTVFEITRFELPEVDFRVVCSKGTYIRALARDFGRTLGSGAYLKTLCRVRIGEFGLQDAQSPETFEQYIQFIST